LLNKEYEGSSSTYQVDVFLETIKELKENYTQKQINQLLNDSLETLQIATNFFLFEYLNKEFSKTTTTKGKGPVIDVTEE